MWVENHHIADKQVNEEVYFLRQENRRLKEQLSRYRRYEIEDRLGVALESVELKDVQTLLFTEDFNRLYYVKDENIKPVTQEKRKWVYDNVNTFDDFYLMVEKEAADDRVDEVEQKELLASDFLKTKHIVNVNDLPAYLKVFRYELGLTTLDVEDSDIGSSSWAKYEGNRVRPQKRTIRKLEQYCNIEVSHQPKLYPVRVQGFGSRLQQLINNSDMSANEVSKRVHATSASMSNYISGKHNPLASNGVVRRLAELFDVSVCYLLTGTNEWK